MFNRCFSSFCLTLLSVFTITSTLAEQIYGSVELGIRTDSQRDPQLRQLGYINYQSDDNRQQMTLDYIAQLNQFSDSQISQLFFEHQFSNDEQIKIGRFHRFDNLGYYTLDGVHYQNHLTEETLNTRLLNLNSLADSVSINAYLGRPERTDDIYALSGDHIAGVSAHFRWNNKNKNTKEELFEKNLTAMADDNRLILGYQALKLEQKSQRLNLAFSAKRQHGFLQNWFGINNRQEFNLSSSLATVDNDWQQAEFEDLLIEARLYGTKVNKFQQNYWQFQYQYYNPEHSRTSFRQRFYSTYAIGKIALAELAYQAQLNQQLGYRIATRISDKERGGTGVGARAQINYKLPSAMSLEAEVDHLDLADIKITSFYAGWSMNPNVLSQFTLQSAVQFEEKPLYGKNKMFGLNGQFRYMFNANLYLSFSLETLFNSKRSNEHLGRFYLVYYFDKEQGQWH